MIFISKNEKGEAAWELILNGRKTVTRRTKPQTVGSIRAVCPGRGKKQVCKILITFQERHIDWAYGLHQRPAPEVEMILQAEAEREGFGSWDELMDWFNKKGIDIDSTYRIGFQLVSNNE